MKKWICYLLFLYLLPQQGFNQNEMDDLVAMRTKILHHHGIYESSPRKDYVRPEVTFRLWADSAYKPFSAAVANVSGPRSRAFGLLVSTSPGLCVPALEITAQQEFFLGRNGIRLGLGLSRSRTSSNQEIESQKNNSDKVPNNVLAQSSFETFEEGKLLLETQYLRSFIDDEMVNAQFGFGMIMRSPLYTSSTQNKYDVVLEDETGLLSVNANQQRELLFNGVDLACMEATMNVFMNFMFKVENYGLRTQVRFDYDFCHWETNLGVGIFRLKEKTPSKAIKKESIAPGTVRYL
ncbi:MAG: hypothetical protein MRY83_07345 [Flavobacteriales bacterium]|nr:hypothetical protein [Flavobacteriales bacterium]